MPQPRSPPGWPAPATGRTVAGRSASRRASRGLVGIKPARGRISNGPLRDPVGELPHQGVLARTVRDAAALLDVMAGAFPDDPFPAPPLPAGETFLAAAGRDPGRLRIGRYSTPVITVTDVDPECMAAYDEASALLVELGPRGRGHRAAVRPRAGRVVRVGLVGAGSAHPGRARGRGAAAAADPLPARARPRRLGHRAGRSGLDDAAHHAHGDQRDRGVRRRPDARRSRRCRRWSAACATTPIPSRTSRRRRPSRPTPRPTT